jgi:hypothetical protein
MKKLLHFDWLRVVQLTKQEQSLETRPENQHGGR